MPLTLFTTEDSRDAPQILEQIRADDSFINRHLGPRDSEIDSMLGLLGYRSLDELIADTVPESIRLSDLNGLPTALSEEQLVKELREIAGRNKVFRSFIGLGYYDTITPSVIQRNILENPGWYTQYTPYQAEIAQGRLEALLNFQTMVANLTGLSLANASLLDEATAAAEAMHMCFAISRGKREGFFVAEDCHPQTIAVIETRAEPLGIDLRIGSVSTVDVSGEDLCGILLQYPTTDGRIEDYSELCARARQASVLVAVATDLLALTLLRPPGEFGADIAIGSSQRFGVPLGAGGPHAAFLATKDEYARRIPGRLVGVSKDADGNTAYRLAIQTREQHIRRDKATSNICTAQVLLAIMASMYAVYHGPEGLTRIANRVQGLTSLLAAGLRLLGHRLTEAPFFDTLHVMTSLEDGATIRRIAAERRMNIRGFDDGSLGISLDETTTEHDVCDLLSCFGSDASTTMEELAANTEGELPKQFRRKSKFLTHEVFYRYRSEHEILRYIHRLQAKDLSMTTSMIPLGSCTMKLNATTEMLPVTWREFGALHPFVPPEQAMGYQQLYSQIESWLSSLTGFAAVSLQPNSGAQGEYAGLLLIRAYHCSRGDKARDVCLIPVSAHGTNPASAVMAGFRVVVINCDDQGNVDLKDLQLKAEENRESLGALMVTYPSTHGVFEEGIQEICQIVHDNGGQVYMDGANMNAQVGLTSPASIGADVCHLNLHKTFCIPHGGGGPGMGPIGVAEHLAPYLPGHPLIATGGEEAMGPVSGAPYGSSSILSIPWSYIRMMGSCGLTKATQVAILNANYMAKRLSAHYEVLYTGVKGRVAHEFILDCQPFKNSAGIEVEDIAKRLMDYGFHAPTMSFPVVGTLMIEPTESESKEELDRLCEALILIREEIAAIEEGRADRNDNALKNAPHTACRIAADTWNHAYGREQAAFPAPWVKNHKFWPPVARIDNALGDRRLVCICPPIESYQKD